METNTKYYLKMVSGEDVVARIEDLQEDSKDVVLEDPMLVNYFAMKDGYGATMRPWIPALSSNEMRINVSKGYVMFIRDVPDKLSDFYESAVERSKRKQIKHDIEEQDETGWDDRLMANAVYSGSDTVH